MRWRPNAKPLPPDLPWDEYLKLTAFDLFERLTEYPGLGAFLLERPLTPAVKKNYPSGVEVFRRAGLDEREAELAQATYHTFMFGLMGMEYRFRPAKRQKPGTVKTMRSSPTPRRTTSSSSASTSSSTASGHG